MHIWLNFEGSSSSDVAIIVTYVDADTSMYILTVKNLISPG
jgi:hypothetical protein